MYTYMISFTKADMPETTSLEHTLLFNMSPSCSLPIAALTTMSGSSYLKLRIGLFDSFKTIFLKPQQTNPP